MEINFPSIVTQNESRIIANISPPALQHGEHCTLIKQLTVIDLVRGQQQFYLTLERICNPKTEASDNRSVRGSNKTAVCPRNQLSITVLFFQNFHLHIHNMFSISSSVKSKNLEDASTLWRRYHVTYWTNENKTIGKQFDSGL